MARPRGTCRICRRNTAELTFEHVPPRAAFTGGGEATIKNRRGKIRDSDTVKHGNDPRSRKDSRH